MKSFEEVSSRVDVDELELKVLDEWEKEKIFEQTLENNRDGKLFTFYDGPPYATGKPHYGHVLQSAIKDTVLRYKTMQGYYVPRRVGWDCHGLPVETLVEKELGLKKKKDIEEYGIEKFNQKCREMVTRYVDEFTAALKRMGRWAEYDKPYFTMDLNYMESEWWVFKEMWDKGLVYRAFRSTPYCIRCETPLSNFEVSSNYKDRVDTAVYVELKVNQELALLIWTTTPWTLSGNVAVAINDKLEYVSVKHENREIIVAKDLVETIFGDEAKIARQWTQDELLKLKYEPLWPEVVANTPEVDSDTYPNLFRVVIGDHVTADEGTGLVHMATAFGEEDAEVGKKYNLPVLRTVETDGKFTEAVPHWAGMGIFESNESIAQELDKLGLLFKQEKYKHSYPFCWRCDTPLIYYALDTWFVKIANIKHKMLAHNEQINWTPKHVKHGRFAKGIESAPDWAVSRNRYWSVPLPIWECDKCEGRVVVGSIDELKKWSGQEDIEDIHRPYVDNIKWGCEKCEGEMQRVAEVLDVWFDSGSMPYSQWHYPFENKDLAEQSFPADFIVEAVEMTRAWFYVMHVIATAIKDGPAFKNAIASGLIFAPDGQKLSKKLKNYPEPEPTIAKFGADVIRMYLLSSSTLGEPYKFSEKDLQHVQRNTYLTLWNVYSFFVRYANVYGYDREKLDRVSENLLDRWMLVRLQRLEIEVSEAMSEYKVDQATRLVIPFIDDLSNWYVRRSRGRFHPSTQPSPEASAGKAGSGQEVGKSDQDDAMSTLYEVLVRLSKVLAPFMPFVSESMYKNLTGEASVHLQMLDDVKPLTEAEQAALDNMTAAREIVTEALALRAKEGIKVRQPLATMTVKAQKMDDELAAIIKDEVNVKELEFVKDLTPSPSPSEGEGGHVTLDTNLTDELKQEGVAREIIRHGQILRREAGYALDDKIKLMLNTVGVDIQAAIDEHKSMIAGALQADEDFSGELGDADANKDLKIGDQQIRIGVKK